MSMHLLLKGLMIGFSIAAPVGPIGLLCIRRAVAEGPRAGLICGLGAATADGAYALVGGFAMTALARWLVQEQRWFGLAGGLFLIYLGIRTIAAKRRRRSCRRARPRCHVRLWLDAAADLGESDDHHVLRRGVCRSRNGRCR